MSSIENKPNLQFAEFIKPAFADNTKHTIIRAGRQTGKTWGAVQWIIYKMLNHAGSKGLRVDTVQTNIQKYIDRYFKPILGDFWDSIEMDNQRHIMKYMNGSILDFGSAQKPENLEGFGYDYVVLNEAGIILKKQGLREHTIEPMTKNAKVKFVGTPKGKTGSKYFELYQLTKTDNDWVDYHYTCYDSPFWNKKDLEKKKARLAGYLRKQEYMGEFIDVYENSILSQSDIMYYDVINLDDFSELYMHADITHTAKETSDFFCLVVLGKNIKDNNYYVVDFILKQIDVGEQAKETIHMYMKYKKKIVKLTYDEKGHQSFGYRTNKTAKDSYDLSLPIEPLKYPSDKVSHFTTHVPHFKSQRVYLPMDHPDISTATNQLLAFPEKGINDDFVDGMSGVLDNFTKEEDAFIFEAI